MTLFGRAQDSIAPGQPLEYTALPAVFFGCFDADECMEVFGTARGGRWARVWGRQILGVPVQSARPSRPDVEIETRLANMALLPRCFPR